MDPIAATLEALTKLVNAQQEQLVQLQNNQNQLGQARQIPLIPTLTKAEDLRSWREQLSSVLACYDLDKYIVKNIPEPEGVTERRKWLNDCLDVKEYIQATVPDPTLHFVLQYFERPTDTFVDLNHELVNIRSRSFPSLAAFQDRVIFLKECLETSDFKMNEKAYTWVALRAVAKQYPELYAHFVVRLQADNLSWAGLMAELQVIAVSRIYDPARTLVAFKLSDPVQCIQCGQMVRIGYRNRTELDSFCQAGVVCSSCKPEQALDTWPFQEA